jgi:putative lipoprotein
MSWRILSFVFCMALLAACVATSGNVDVDVAAVTGTVTHLERRALPPEAVVIVRLQDISRADAPATLLGEQRIELDGRQVPVAFEIGYDRAAIDERMSYSVSARIELGDELLMISDTVHPVITRGAPTSNLEIRVVPVRR